MGVMLLHKGLKALQNQRDIQPIVLIKFIAPQLVHRAGLPGVVRPECEYKPVVQRCRYQSGNGHVQKGQECRTDGPD